MISAISWIPKGVAKTELEPTVLSPEELAALRVQQAGSQDSEDESEWEEGSSDDDASMDEEAAVAKAQAMADSVKGITGAGDAGAEGHGPSDETLAAAMAELDMEHYDDSDGEDDATINRIMGASGNPGMAFYKNPEDDPYLKSKGAGDSDSDSETEAMVLQRNDLLIMAARNEDDVSHLEVWVYEEPDERGPANLYVHHTILLPAFPLSVAWLDLAPGQEGRRNIAALGSFEPGIELWDLDRMDAVEPLCTLGGADYAATKAAAAAAASASKGKKGKKKKAALPSVEVRPGSHTDAVLGLAWNREFRNVLASASADHSVKVWDVATESCTHTLTHHRSKAQAVAWNPAEAPILLSGGFDRHAALVDLRVADAEPAKWSVTADVEALAWDPHAPTTFVVASEDGSVSCFDARKGSGSEAVYTLAAHRKATCALSFCPSVSGLLLTASTDKKVKLWNTRGSEPALLATQDLKVGAVFSAGFCADSPLLVAAGGAAGTVAVWDTARDEAVAAFAGAAGPAAQE